MKRTRFLTALSSPPCGTCASTETCANSTILAFTAEFAVWSIRVIRAGWQKEKKSVTCNVTNREEVRRIGCWSCHTYVSHSESQTSRWRRSSHRGLAGKNETLCSPGQSYMIVGSFCQTFLLRRLQTAEKAYSQMCLLRWLFVFWSNSFTNLPSRIPLCLYFCAFF